MVNKFFEEISQIVEQRGKDYGSPLENHVRIAKGWAGILGFEPSPVQVGLCMLYVKQARLSKTQNHLDSIKDIAGYAYVINEVVKAMSEMQGKGVDISTEPDVG